MKSAPDITHQRKEMRDFSLEVFFSRWEFAAKYHMTASDLESMTVGDLLSLASPEQRDQFESLSLGYTETWGAADLREEIAKTYEGMEAENILCLAGAGEGLYAVARCLLQPGDHAIVPTPNYQSAETIPLSICDVTGVPLAQDAHHQWCLDLTAVEAAIRPNTKLISVNFPHNPTGMLMGEETLKGLVSLCRRHGIFLLSDEVYRGVELNPADQMPQIADIYEKGISLNVMSKAYGLPGLRIGWIAAQDKAVLQKVERYKHYLSICNSAPSERLAVIALQVRDQIFKRNHGIMVENVTALERLFNDFPGIIDWTRPMGGCVVFPKYTGPGNGEEFCKTLLEESGVLLLPSSIYKSELTETPADHFRIGFGRKETVRQGIIAMRGHFEKHFASFVR